MIDIHDTRYFFAQDEEEKADEDTQKEDQEFKKRATKGSKIPTGKVVGIVKRNWRQYCGMLQKSVVKGVRGFRSL